ncbi:hypothetical protein AAG906_026796 [Vitis piasezkii]
MEVNSEKGDRRRRVGLVYDDRMCKHATADGDHYPENPDRIRAIWKKLESAGILQRCVVFNAKEVEDKHILSVHNNHHVNLIKNISSKQFDSRRNRIASKFNSIYMNEGSLEAAYLAAGSVIESQSLKLPPGHHAEQDEPMGFCLYNNVAIATTIGDPLRGCRVTPYGYSVMLKKLMEFAEGKIIMALEGGYNLVSLANSVLACVEVLLEDKPIAGSSEAYPFESTWYGKAMFGSVDRNPPKEIMWKTVLIIYSLVVIIPHMGFWRVAFLNPEENKQDRAYICLYIITLEQLNDVLLQENASSYDISSPLFDLVALTLLLTNSPSLWSSRYVYRLHELCLCEAHFV